MLLQWIFDVGFFCLPLSDVDECFHPDLNKCPNNSVCHNLLGSSTCNCSAGFLFNESSRTCFGNPAFICCSICLTVSLFVFLPFSLSYSRTISFFLSLFLLVGWCTQWLELLPAWDFACLTWCWCIASTKTLYGFLRNWRMWERSVPSQLHVYRQNQRLHLYLHPRLHGQPVWNRSVIDVLPFQKP